jgi:TRAP-type C4-dicarboxylate transport system permease small subunit
MLKFAGKLSNLMSVIAGVVLLMIIGLTFGDVVLRYLRRPIPGTFELVSFLGVAVVAFALPRASLMKAHVYVDLLVDKLPAKWHKTFRIFTRLLVFIMFLIGAWYFVFMARNLIVTGTVTLTLRVPFYPVVFALAACCIVQCIVSISEVINELGGDHNE